MVRHKVMHEAEAVAQAIADRVHVVYDIGACRGAWSKQYEEIFPEAQFYLFDAVRKPYAQTGDRWTWIEAVLSRPGMGDVDFFSNSGGGDSYYREITGAFDGVTPERRGTVTLDEMDLPAPQVMKLDTQGSELDILMGAEKALDEALMLQIEVSVTPYNEGAPGFDDYIRFMMERDFVPIKLEEIHFWGPKISQFDLVFVANRIASLF